MFKKIEPLTQDKHQDIRFTSIQNFNFARNISNAPIAFSEFLHASRYYPIVFLKDISLPVVLLSLNQNQNNFINPDGSWKVPYIPAHFRQYPFILAKAAPVEGSQQGSSSSKEGADTNNNQDKYVVCIDRDAPHFESTQGELIFTANGQFTEMTNKAVEFLKLYQQEMAVTSTIVKLMEEKEILVERQFNMNVDGKNISVGGFRTVDVQKLNALEDALLADWVRKGIISFILNHMNSLAGIQIS